MVISPWNVDSVPKAKGSGGLDFSKPPLIVLRVSIGLLHDGFFSFAVVRQMVSLFSC